MSTIASGVTTTTALVSTGTTDGTLQLQVNGTTPSVTLNALGAVGVGSTPSYGTSGQALISGGSATAPNWGTLGTGAGGTGLTTVGTNGQVLQSNGTSLTWATPSAGAMTLLNTLTASSSASLSDTTSLTSSYDLYMFAFENVIPATDYVRFVIQYSSNGGSTWLTSGYDSTYSDAFTGTLNNQSWAQSAGVIIGQASSTDGGIRSTAGYGLSGTSYMQAPASTSARKYTYGTGGFYIIYQTGGPTSIMPYIHAGAYDANTALNAVRFLFSSGNIASGKIRVYGIKTS